MGQVGDEKLARLHNTFIENVALDMGKHKCIPIGTSAVELTTGLVDNRSAVYIYNDDDNTADLFIGFGNTVSSTPGNAAFGVRLKPGQGLPIQVGSGDDLKLYGISTSAGQKIVVMESR